MKKIILDFASVCEYFGLKNVLISPGVRVNDFFKLLKDRSNGLGVDKLNRLIWQSILALFSMFLLHGIVDIL